MSVNLPPPGATTQYLSDHNDHFRRVVEAGTPIWEDIYAVRVRYRDTFSIEHLKEFGMPSTMDPVRDQQAQNEKVTVMLTIDAIVEKFRVGIPVEFVNNGDTERIYEVINRYLVAWNEQFQHGVNVMAVPLDDLVLLDQVADKLYSQSRIFNGPRKRPQSDFVADLMQGVGIFNKLAHFGRGETLESTNQVDRHPSLAKAFTDRLYRGVVRPEEKKSDDYSGGTSRWK